jgi:hypothetical protein
MRTLTQDIAPEGPVQGRGVTPRVRLMFDTPPGPKPARPGSARCAAPVPGARGPPDQPLWSLMTIRGWQSASGMTECHASGESGLLTRPPRRWRSGGIASATELRAAATAAMEPD